MVARLRYRIYCEQLKLLRDLADHDAKTLRLANDEESVILFALADGEAVGTLRVVPGPIARSEPDTVTCFQLDELDGTVTPEDYVVLDRFMLDSRFRSGPLSWDLMMAATAEALGLGVTTGFACCETHLVSLYTGFGFTPYTSLYNHPTSGVLVPLVFVGDPDHLRDVGSPVAAFITDENRSPVIMAQIRSIFGRAAVATTLQDDTIGQLEMLAQIDDRPRMLDGFSKHDLELVTDRGAEMQFATGDALIRSGQTAQTIYVILSGACEVRNDSLAVAVLGPGDVVGEMTFLLEERRSSDVVAISDLRTLAFQASSLRAVVEQADPTAVKLLHNMARVLADRRTLVGDRGN